MLWLFMSPSTQFYRLYKDELTIQWNGALAEGVPNARQDRFLGLNKHVLTQVGIIHTEQTRAVAEVLRVGGDLLRE